jgi:predicted ATPase
MIERLELINFKAFRQVGLDLRPLTLLTGVNAVGKSTVLQALAVLQQSADAGMLGPDGSLALQGDLVELGTGADLLHEDFLVDADNRPFVEVALSTRAEVEGATARSTQFWRVTYDAPGARTADVLRLTPSEGGGTDPFGENFHYLRADRIVPAVTYPKSHEMTVRRRSLGARGEHTANFLRVHRDSAVDDRLRHARGKSAALLDQVEAWLQELCPGVNIDIVDIVGADLVQLNYGFFARVGLAAPAIRYRPTNVGFGLTYALPIVVACLSAGPGSLVLLENPEAHLHPRLISLAASAGTQLVVETHSDHVLNGVRLAVKEGKVAHHEVAVHYFSRGDETSADRPVPGVRVHSPVMTPDGMLSTWPEGFFDELDNTVVKLLEDGSS